MDMVNVATLCASAVWHASGAALSKCSFDVSWFFYVAFVSMGKKYMYVVHSFKSSGPTSSDV